MPPSIGRGQPFDPRDGRQYATLYCPICAMPENGNRDVAMACNALIAHGPGEHHARERIDAITYDYVCSERRCGFRLNYPHRLLA